MQIARTDEGIRHARIGTLDYLCDVYGAITYEDIFNMVKWLGETFVDVTGQRQDDFVRFTGFVPRPYKCCQRDKFDDILDKCCKED